MEKLARQPSDPAKDPLRRVVVTVIAAARTEQAAVAAAWLARTAGASRAIVAEGAAIPLPAPPSVASIALGAGCPCCVGSVVLRAALTRLWRGHRPAHTLLLIDARRHLERLAERLLATPFGIALEVHIDEATHAG